MPTDPTSISLADLVLRAAAIVDPDSEDPAVAELVERLADADEPVRGILDSLEERLAWGADEDPAVVMAQAVVLYLATGSTRSTTPRSGSCASRRARSSTAIRPRRCVTGSSRARARPEPLWPA